MDAGCCCPEYPRIYGQIAHPIIRKCGVRRGSWISEWFWVLWLASQITPASPPLQASWPLSAPAFSLRLWKLSAPAPAPDQRSVRSEYLCITPQVRAKLLLPPRIRVLHARRLTDIFLCLGQTTKQRQIPDLWYTLPEGSWHRFQILCFPDHHLWRTTFCQASFLSSLPLFHPGIRLQWFQVPLSASVLPALLCSGITLCHPKAAPSSHLFRVLWSVRPDKSENYRAAKYALQN